jgi:hypothetical protein
MINNKGTYHNQIRDLLKLVDEKLSIKQTGISPLQLGKLQRVLKNLGLSQELIGKILVNNFQEEILLEEHSQNKYHLSELGNQMAEIYLSQPQRWRASKMVEILEKISEKLNNPDENLNKHQSLSMLQRKGLIQLAISLEKYPKHDSVQMESIYDQVRNSLEEYEVTNSVNLILDSIQFLIRCTRHELVPPANTQQRQQLLLKLKQALSNISLEGFLNYLETFHGERDLIE